MTPHRFLLLALLVPAIPAACTARRDPPGGRPLPAAVAVMTETAEVGTDEAFDEYKKDEQIVPAFVAPAALRSLLASGEVRTVSRVSAGARWDDGRLALVWAGQLSVTGERDQIEGRLADLVGRAGLKPADGALTTYLAGEFTRREAERTALWAGSKNPPPKSRVAWAFGRTVGTAREEVLFPEPGRPISRGGRTQVDFEWCVAADLPGGPPTLKTLLDAAPALRPVHREPGLLDSLTDAPAYWYVSDGMGWKDNNLGWDLRTDARYRAGFEAALKAAGFEPGKEERLPSGLGTQFSWARPADGTFASVIDLAEPKGRIMVGCQAPQSPPKK